MVAVSVDHHCSKVKGEGKEEWGENEWLCGCEGMGSVRMVEREATDEEN